MASNVHKRIVFAGLGCAGALAVFLTLSFLIAVREDPTLLSNLTAMTEYATPAMSAAALDSLGTFDWSPLQQRRTDGLVLRPTGNGNGATMAVALWSGRRFRAPVVPYGDTAKPESRRYTTWLTYTNYRGVDSLIESTLSPWAIDRAIASRDSSGGILSTTLNPYAIMNTTRAVLARAAQPRFGRDESRPDTAALAAVTIARALQAEPVLVHIVTGLRVERDALAFLARRKTPGAQRSLEQVERALATGLRGLHLVRIAGAVPAHARVLTKAATNPGLPIAVRREILIAIGYGWALNPQEVQSFGQSRERSAALEALDPATLPVPLRRTLASARRAADVGMSTRIVVGPEYQTLTAALRTVW